MASLCSESRNDVRACGHVRAGRVAGRDNQISNLDINKAITDQLKWTSNPVLIYESVWAKICIYALLYNCTIFFSHVL